MHERSLVGVKVEPRSTSRLSSTRFILPLLYLPDYNLRALMCVAKNASVEINLKFEKQLFTFTTYLEQVTTTATPAKKGAKTIISLLQRF